MTDKLFDPYLHVMAKTYQTENKKLPIRINYCDKIVN